MIDTDDIAVAVQQRLRHADGFDSFLDALQDLIEQHRVHQPAVRRNAAGRRKAVRKKRKKQTGRRAVTAAETQRIVKLRTAKVPFQQIADQLGRAPSVVRNVWRRAQA